MIDKKIIAVVVTPPEYLASGGVAAGFNLSTEISKHIDLQVATLALENSFSCNSDGLRIHSFKTKFLPKILLRFLPKPCKNLFCRSNDLVAFIKKEKPDLVHLHNPHPIGVFYEIAKTCAKLNIKLVASSHGFVEFAYPESWIGGGLLRQIIFKITVGRKFKKALSKLDMVFFTSPQEVTLLRERGLYTGAYSIVTNGFNKALPESLSEEKINGIRQKFSLSANSATYFYVGNHTPNKGIDTLVQALSASNGSWRLVIGGGRREESKLESFIKSDAYTKVAARLTITGFLSNEELAGMYQIADAFVFPTQADTLPLVLLDAMRYSLPIISTNVGGIPYQVTKENGILLEPGDYISLSATLDSLQNNKSRMVKMGACSHTRVFSIFDWRISAKNAIKHYKQLLSQ